MLQMHISSIQQKTAEDPEAQYIDKFVDVFPPSHCAENGGSATGSIS